VTSERRHGVSRSPRWIRRGCIHGPQVPSRWGSRDWKVDTSTYLFPRGTVCIIAPLIVGPRKGAALGDEYTAGYWHISDVLRHVQRTAIEVENAPDKRKRLRSFAVQEVAALLDVDRAELQ